jgi:type VI secretion system protein ImpB
MGKSYQNEVPRSRVNITLDVETGGARRKQELPLKLLVMGDYSKGKTEGRVVERERISVDRNNIEAVLENLSPQLQLEVPNQLAGDGSEIGVELTFKSMKSFHPEEVARQIPELNNMLAMRNLLKDLKSNLLDNGKFRKELERILQNEPELDELMKELRGLGEPKPAADK